MFSAANHVPLTPLTFLRRARRAFPGKTAVIEPGGTAILNRLACFTGEIGSMVLMFQAEVARRLRAETDTKEWGSLSIWIQNRWDVKKLLAVPPGAGNVRSSVR